MHTLTKPRRIRVPGSGDGSVLVVNPVFAAAFDPGLELLSAFEPGLELLVAILFFICVAQVRNTAHLHWERPAQPLPQAGQAARLPHQDVQVRINPFLSVPSPPHPTILHKKQQWEQKQCMWQVHSRVLGPGHLKMTLRPR